MKRPNLPLYGALCVLGGFLYHLALGYYYTVGTFLVVLFCRFLGNMNPYIISYMNIKSSEASWFSSTLLALQAVFMPVGAILAGRVGYRAVFVIAMLLSAYVPLIYYSCCDIRPLTCFLIAVVAFYSPVLQLTMVWVHTSLPTV